MQTGLSDTSGWVILSSAEAAIKHKVEALGTPLKDWDISIYRGILTGYNEAFIIDSKTRDMLIMASPKAVDIIRPILFGENIKRFRERWKEMFLINTHNGVKSLGLPRINIEKEYPAVYKYLYNFYEPLSKRGDKGDHWTNLRNCAYLNDFDKPKIIYPEITKFLNFFYDSEGKYLTNNKCFILTGNFLEFLTCFLNSKLFRFCFMSSFPRLPGDTFELRKIFFLQIPILRVDESQNFSFKKLLDKFNSSLKDNDSLTELEFNSNKAIYEMYNLDATEIDTIENRVL